MSGYNLDGYIDVPTRIKLFMARHPEGSLQMEPPQFVEVEGKKWVIGRAYAYRTPEDQRPGVGTAWEIVPGTTPFTRGSEIQNLETSAWGRAIGALGIGIDASIATLDEIQHAKERSKVMRTTEALPDDPWLTDAPVAQYQTDTPAPTHKTVSKGSSMYPATEGQVKAIHAILGKQGTSDPLDKLAAVNAWLTNLNKTAVTSITEVNKHDASGLIDSLQTPP
jgi:hypothetical protein